MAKYLSDQELADLSEWATCGFFGPWEKGMTARLIEEVRAARAERLIREERAAYPVKP